MKKIITISLFTFCFILSYGQSWNWGKEGYSQSALAFGSGYADHSIAVDNAGNTYMGGSFYGKFVFGMDTLNSGANYSIYLVKYDYLGNVIWARQALETYSIDDGGGCSVALDRVGNIYITGFFAESICFGTDTLKGSNAIAEDMYITKYDANGNVIWAKQEVNRNNTSYAYGNSVAVDTSGNAYVAGTFSGIISFDNDTLKDLQNWIIPLGSDGWLHIEDIFLVKYDGSGNVLWARQANTPSIFSDGYGASVAVDKNGNAYITGTFEDTLSFTGDSLKTFRFNSDADLFLVKYNTNGNVIWAKQTTNIGVGSIGGYSISMDAPGGIYITGLFNDTVSFGTDTIKESSETDAFLAKYNEGGNVVWTKQAVIIDSNGYGGWSVVCDTLKQGGGYLLINNNGYRNSPAKLKFGTDTFKLGTTFGPAVIMQFDSAGNPLCGMMFNNNAGYYGGSLGVSHSGQFIYLAGDIDTTTVYGPDTLTLGNVNQGLPFLANWQPCHGGTVQGINEIKPNEIIVVYPNPFSNYTTIAINKEGNHTLELDDITGRKLMLVQYTGKQYELASHSLAQGMYFVRIFDEANTLLGTTKIVIER